MKRVVKDFLQGDINGDSGKVVICRSEPFETWQGERVFKNTLKIVMQSISSENLME
jgi:hypothetical protein